MAPTPQESPKKRSASTTKRPRKTALQAKNGPTSDEIAQRARELYEKSGCPGGRDEEFWLDAERQLHDERKA